MRTRRLWSLSNFDDGFIDNRGRFRVWMPDHPRAYDGGYILRAIVAYEAYHGDKVTPDFAIHHKNGDTIDDSKENLEKIKFGEHTAMHNDARRVPFTCKKCRKEFKLPVYRAKVEGRGQFCSQECYINFPKSDDFKNKVSQRMKLAHKRGVVFSRPITTWSRKYDECVKCGGTSRGHSGYGLCTLCYMRKWKGAKK